MLFLHDPHWECFNKNSFRLFLFIYYLNKGLWCSVFRIVILLISQKGEPSILLTCTVYPKISLCRMCKKVKTGLMNQRSGVWGNRLTLSWIHATLLTSALLFVKSGGAVRVSVLIDRSWDTELYERERWGAELNHTLFLFFLCYW